MTFSLYLNNLDEEYQLSVYKAIRDEAKALGFNLVCVQGETVNRISNSTLSTFPSRSFLASDGVLLLSSVIIDRNDQAGMPSLKDRFGETPCVSIGNRLFDFPSIIIKSRSSMERIMEHLIVDHAYRKFLYIGGPATHRDNTVREHVFRRSINLRRSDFPELEETVANGGFNEQTGSEIVRRYIAKNRDRPLDAIVAANDNMAIGALKEIQTCPDPRWHRCAVTGFDDVPQARLESPALTTVRQPLDVLGVLAVRTLADLLAEKDVPAVVHIDSEPVIRESCGCARLVSPSTPSDQRDNLALALEQVQYQSIKSEQHLRNIGYFGQTLIMIDTHDELCEHLGNYLQNLGVRSFHLIVYPEQAPRIPEEGLLLYEWGPEGEQIWANGGKSVKLRDYFSSLLPDSDLSQTLSLYHLVSGELQLGLIVYDAEDFAHPYICSSAIFISNTLRRLDLLKREKERARLLEHEVALRTADLVQTNRRLAEEARRRIKVEAEVLRISEMERLRFSLDLHDDICQRLAGISMYCKALPAIPDDVTEMVDETLTRTRRYAHDSFPVELDDLGLNEALRGLCAQLEKTGPCVCEYRWSAGDRSPLSRAQDINIYRIVQEALQNVAKHSKAEHAEVSVVASENALLVRISDDGRGNPAISSKKGSDGAEMDGRSIPEENAAMPASGRQQRRKNGLGLTSMRYRAHQLQARFAIHSGTETGTVIEIAIPLASSGDTPILDAEIET